MDEDSLAAWTAELGSLGRADYGVTAGNILLELAVVPIRCWRPLMAWVRLELEYYRVGQKARRCWMFLRLDRTRDMASLAKQQTMVPIS